MTKIEMATAIAQHMNEIKKEVNIERMAKVLMKNDTIKELEAAMRGFGIR